MDGRRTGRCVRAAVVVVHLLQQERRGGYFDVRVPTHGSNVRAAQRALPRAHLAVQAEDIPAPGVAREHRGDAFGGAQRRREQHQTRVGVVRTRVGRGCARGDVAMYRSNPRSNPRPRERCARAGQRPGKHQPCPSVCNEFGPPKQKTLFRFRFLVENGPVRSGF